MVTAAVGSDASLMARVANRFIASRFIASRRIADRFSASPYPLAFFSSAQSRSV